LFEFFDKEKEGDDITNSDRATECDTAKTTQKVKPRSRKKARNGLFHKVNKH